MYRYDYCKFMYILHVTQTFDTQHKAREKYRFM